MELEQTSFINGKQNLLYPKIPFFLSSRAYRDPTVPTTQYNGLCHATLVGPGGACPGAASRASTASRSRTDLSTYTLWWVSQWVEWRKTRIAENGDPLVAAHVRSYKEWVRTTGARAAAGMGGGSVPQTPGGGFVPQTPQ